MASFIQGDVQSPRPLNSMFYYQIVFILHVPPPNFPAVFLTRGWWVIQESFR